MFKNKLFIVILLAAIFASGNAYCQFEIKDKQATIVSGKVTYVDVEGSVINVQTDSGKMAFYISVESELLRYAHHIASLEIQVGDPVIVQYASTAAGKNFIIKLEDNKPDTI